jgi:hypothetical protein
VVELSNPCVTHVFMPPKQQLYMQQLCVQGMLSWEALHMIGQGLGRTPGYREQSVGGLLACAAQGTQHVAKHSS